LFKKLDLFINKLDSTWSQLELRYILIPMNNPLLFSPLIMKNYLDIYTSNEVFSLV